MATTFMCDSYTFQNLRHESAYRQITDVWLNSIWGSQSSQLSHYWCRCVPSTKCNNIFILVKRFLEHPPAHSSCVNNSHVPTLADSCLHQTPPWRRPSVANVPTAVGNAVTGLYLLLSLRCAWCADHIVMETKQYYYTINQKVILPFCCSLM